MENTVPYSEDCLIFDLKGSSIDRLVPLKKDSQEYQSEILKDENFRIIGKKVKIGLKESEELIEVLQEDMKILRNIGIMDYSLLLGIPRHKLPKSRYSIGKNYYLSIIDLFQLFDSSKAIERWFKIYIRRVNRKLISVVSPQEYYERLINFVQSIFTEREEIEMSFNF